MDISKTNLIDFLREDLGDKLYTDVKLTLTDNRNTITIDVHKIVLIASCDYFKNYFSFHKDISQANINIANAEIMRDIVLSFYNVNHELTNDNILDVFECRDFLLLKNDIRQLYDKTIKPDKFAQLLNVIENFDMNEECLRYIKKNISSDYLLSNFSMEFIKELDNVRLNGIFAILGSDKLIADYSYRYSGQFGLFNPIVIYHDDNHRNVRIYDHKGKILYVINCDKNAYRIAFTLDGKYIIAIGSHIEKFCAISTKLLSKIAVNIAGHIIDMTISKDCQKFSYAMDDVLIISDMDMRKEKIVISGKHNMIKFSYDGEKLISCCEHKINIYESLTGNVLRSIHYDGIMFGIESSPDSTRIVSVQDLDNGHYSRHCRQIIVIYDIDSGMEVQNIVSKISGYSIYIYIYCLNDKLICYNDEAIYVYNALDGKFLYKIIKDVECITASDTQLFLVCLEKVFIYCLETGELQITVDNNSEHFIPLHITLSADASTDIDKKIKSYLRSVNSH